MEVLKTVIEKTVEHVRAHHGERPTHVMLPAAEAKEVRDWIAANPEIVTNADQIVTNADHVNRTLAGLTLIEGDEFKVWRDASRPVYRGRFSQVFKCRDVSPSELAALGQPSAVAGLAQFIVTAGSLWPGYPIYRAWFVSVITLADMPGVPPAKKDSPEMTHEILFITADPNVDFDPDPQKPETWFSFAGKVAQQFTATDDQAVRIGEKCARAILATLEHLTTPDHRRPGATS